jgi:hypothetical protein
MNTITVAPGLKLDEDMYELAADAVASRLPNLAPLTFDDFIAPSLWSNIPDETGELSKAEAVLMRSRHLTVKINVWFREDLRGAGAPAPHNHPWESFTSYVLGGGYDEDRWHVDAVGNIVETLGVEHHGPTANLVGHDIYHEVTAVHEPGRTMSLMVCGSGRRGDWGYLDLATGAHNPLQPIANFAEMFAALNPHRR